MSGTFFDTNVLLYTQAAGDPRRVIAHQVLAQGGIISVQVLNEFANVAYRTLKLPWKEIASALDDIRILCGRPVPLAVELHLNALRLASSGSLAFYDALIVAAALGAGCDTLLSEDMQDGCVIDGRLTIRNSFHQL